MDWGAITGAGIGGVVSGIIGTLIWAWGKIGAERRASETARLEAERNQNEIDAKAERDDYEMDKVRRSDAYQELSKEVVRLNAKIDAQDAKIVAQDARIAASQAKELECQSKVARLEVESYKQTLIIAFLENRLGLSVTSEHGAIIAKMAAEAAAIASAAVAREVAEKQKDIEHSVERLKVHDKRTQEQIEVSRRELERLRAGGPTQGAVMEQTVREIAKEVATEVPKEDAS
jgi:hypothetical protein